MFQTHISKQLLDALFLSSKVTLCVQEHKAKALLT